MAPTILLRSAPFCSVRYDSCDRNYISSGTTSETILRSNSSETNVNFRKRMRNLSKKDKLLLRRIKNTEAAKASREKAKLQEKLLEQRLVDLQYEKMKLLLEKEALTKQNMELCKENSNLKNKVQNKNFPVNEENFCGSTFRQAEGMGSFQDFHHSNGINLGIAKSELCDASNSSFQKFGKCVQNPQISAPASKPYRDVDNASFKLLSQFSLTEWLNNPENDCISDQIFSLLESNGLSHENDKGIEYLNESSLEEQIQEFECYKELEGFFENCEVENSKSKPDVEARRSQSILIGNNDSTISNTDKINQTFIELLPQWTFDNLYEDIN